MEKQGRVIKLFPKFGLDGRMTERKQQEPFIAHFNVHAKH